MVDVEVRGLGDLDPVVDGEPTAVKHVTARIAHRRGDERLGHQRVLAGVTAVAIEVEPGGEQVP